MAEKHTLHLIQADRSRPASIARGISHALRVAGFPRDATLARTVEDTVRRAMTEALPIGLAELEDAGVVEQAAAVLEEKSRGACVAGVDLTPDDLAALADADSAAREADAPEADADGSDFTSPYADDDGPTRDASDTALVLLAHNNGNVATTYSQARMLARTTGDEALYAEVCRCLVTAFGIEFA